MKTIVKNITNYVILLSVVAILLGIVLIVYSVVNIVYMLIVKKNAKDVEKIIAEKKDVINIDTDAE